MNEIPSSKSIDYSVIRNVFRRSETIDSQSSLLGCYSQDHEPSSSHDELHSSNIAFRKSERDEIKDIECRARSISHDIFYVSSELNDDDRDYFVADSREPDDDCRQANEDGTRVGSQIFQSDMLSIARRASSEDDYGRLEFLRNMESPLKRANPIFESDSEAEHIVEVSRHHSKRRRSMIVGGSPSSTHLFWTDALPTE